MNTGNTETPANVVVLKRATPQHRLGGIVLDTVLAVCTLLVGWCIWSLFLWNRGQTPGKQLLKMRAYDSKTVRPVKWLRMLKRQFLIPFGLLLIVSIINGFLSDAGYPDSVVLGIALWGYSIADALWIFKNGERRRLLDHMAGTVIVNEAGSTHPLAS